MHARPCPNLLRAVRPHAVRRPRRAGVRAASGAALALAVGIALAMPAAAQVQQNDPNAANAALARQGEVRALQQQRTSDFNLLNMQAQRNVQYRPPAPGGGVSGLRPAGGRARSHRGGGFDPGICVGC